jgi:hypothetical protein
MIIYNCKFLKGAEGLTLWPFIFLKQSKEHVGSVTIHHEKIHLRQQAELFILPFYVLYLLDFLFGLIKYRSVMISYLNIIFEKEAYENMNDTGYLHTRRLFAWIKYL